MAKNVMNKPSGPIPVNNLAFYENNFTVSTFLLSNQIEGETLGSESRRCRGGGAHSLCR